MKCNECSRFKNNICQKAQEELSSLDDQTCLLRVMVMLLRDIWAELATEGEDRQDGEWWKKID